MLIDLPRSLYQEATATDAQRSKIKAIKYVMDTLKNQSASKPDQNILPYRTYIWEGAPEVPEDPATPEIEYKAAWCFKYGEEEWLARKEFGKIKKAATGTAIKAGIGRVNCLTGAPL